MSARGCVIGMGLALLGGAAASSAPGATSAAALPQGSAQQQTSPRVRPRVASPRSRVAVFFTLADTPGQQGVVSSDYRVQVRRPPGTRAACRSRAPARVTAGARNTVARVPLRRPASGWCPGRYRLTVFLERGPYCPKPDPGKPPTPCPLFASQDLDVGRASFLVRG